MKERDQQPSLRSLKRRDIASRDDGTRERTRQKT